MTPALFLNIVLAIAVTIALTWVYLWPSRNALKRNHGAIAPIMLLNILTPFVLYFAPIPGVVILAGSLVVWLVTAIWSFTQKNITV